MSSQIELEQQDLVQIQPLKGASQDYTLIARASQMLEHSGPREVLEWAFNQFGDRVTIATGFGAEGISLIDIAVAINPRADVFFLDTGFLFPETYDLKRRLQDRYSIQIRSVSTSQNPEKQHELYGTRLKESDTELCSRLTKLDNIRITIKR